MTAIELMIVDRSLSAMQRRSGCPSGANQSNSLGFSWLQWNDVTSLGKKQTRSCHFTFNLASLIRFYFVMSTIQVYDTSSGNFSLSGGRRDFHMNFTPAAAVTLVPFTCSCRTES